MMSVEQNEPPKPVKKFWVLLALGLFLLLILPGCFFIGIRVVAFLAPFSEDRSPERAEKLAIDLALVLCERQYDKCQHTEVLVFQERPIKAGSTAPDVTNIYCVATKIQYQSDDTWQDAYFEATIEFYDRDNFMNYNDYSSSGEFSPYEPFDCTPKVIP